MVPPESYDVVPVVKGPRSTENFTYLFRTSWNLYSMRCWGRTKVLPLMPPTPGSLNKFLLLSALTNKLVLAPGMIL